MQQALFDIGTQWILFLQGFGSSLKPLMLFFSFLGREEFYILILPLIYWCFDQRLGIRIGIMLMSASALNNALKLLFHTPRPYWYNQEVQAYSQQTSFGAPSGHAQTSSSVWGLVAYDLRKKAGWAAALTIILLIGVSRLYLGVHFVHDVLLGWIIGALTIWVFIKVWTPAENWLRGLSTQSQIGAAFLFSLVLIIINWFPQLLLKSWRMPPAWQENILQWQTSLPDPTSISGAFSSAGTLFGFSLGLIWISRRGGFAPASGTWMQKLVRYLLGLVGLLILWYGLGQIAPHDELFTTQIIRYGRYALVGFWVGGLAPWLFGKIRLA